jgi:hypothetical protein
MPDSNQATTSSLFFICTTTGTVSSFTSHKGSTGEMQGIAVGRESGQVTG